MITNVSVLYLHFTDGSVINITSGMIASFMYHGKLYSFPAQSGEASEAEEVCQSVGAQPVAINYVQEYYGWENKGWFT